jgi:hypothetical protein
MKKLIPILCVILTFQAHAQTIYLADTAFVTDPGYGGAPASCKTNGMMYNGLNMERAQSVWVADAFTIPAGATWTFDTVIVYGYQYASSPLPSPFISCNLQIFNGAPGLGGTVIWGDTVVNRLNSSAFTGIYKVDTFSSDGALLSTKRPIMALKLHLSPAASLTAGTYWLCWSAAVSTSPTTNPAVTPYQVLPGRLNPPGQMSRIGYGGSWQYATDNGLNIGLNFIIKGKAGLAGITEQERNAAGMLGQNIPNPAVNRTTIGYDLPAENDVQLTVYNMMGQLVATPVNCHMSAGRHEVALNTGDLPSGAYYYRLCTPAGTESRQMMITK